MNRKSNDAETLAEWLTIATHGLVPASCERIKLEIRAHYAEIVAARIADGMNQPDAESAALLELGDPSVASKKFRKRHLTTIDQITIRKWAESIRMMISFGWVCASLTLVNCVWLWFFANSLAKRPRFEYWCTFAWAVLMLLVIVVANFKFHQLRKEKLPAKVFFNRAAAIQQIPLMATISANLSASLASRGLLWWTMLNLIIAAYWVATWAFQAWWYCRTLNKTSAPEFFEPASK